MCKYQQCGRSQHFWLKFEHDYNQGAVNRGTFSRKNECPGEAGMSGGGSEKGGM